MFVAAACISPADDDDRADLLGDTVSSVADDGGDDADPGESGNLPSLSDGDPATIDARLENGLRYLVRENDNPGGKVELRLVIDAGSALEDPSTQSGVAHFLEHMLFNGTERFPKNELIDVLRSFGASLQADVNAYTSFDETVYTLTVPTTDRGAVETGLDVLDQWMSAATIAPDDVAAERGIVLDEWRVRDQTSTGRLTNELIDLYLDGTIYDGRRPIGEPSAIEAMTADPLRTFYDDWYRPNTAAVIVVGDIDADTVEEWIVERFADDRPRVEPVPDRPELTVDPSTASLARVVDDPDLPEGYAIVGWPVSRTARSASDADDRARVERAIVRDLAFDIVATRLGNDALRGEAPFDSVQVDDTSLVRDLDSPAIRVAVDGADAAAAVESVLIEFERLTRFGVTDDEVDRAVGNARTRARSTFEGRGSRQDRSYADEYVQHVLTGAPYVTAQREFDFVSEVLDRVSGAQIRDVAVDHLEASAPHTFVAVPSGEAADGPSEDRLVQLAAGLAELDIAPRAAEEPLGDELVERPDAQAEESRDRLADGPFPGFIDPIVVTFPNGVRVAANANDIVEGQVFLEARSPGGLAMLADGDVAAGQAAGAVIGDSGVGSFDRVAVEDFLSDKDVSLVPFVDVFTDGFDGQVSTADLEVMFQLIHLTMTTPRADPVAVERYVDDRLPFVEDPSLSPDYAEFAALRDARYDDPRFLSPTAEQLESLDASAITRVAVDRFGDAGDWTFSFSGDLDVETLVELAASYLGSLPAERSDPEPVGEEEPPPAGVVVVDVAAGEGETANVSFLVTSSATRDRRDDVLAGVVESVIANRLTDHIREELGDSYSPFAALQLGPGAAPQTDLYVSVSTSPDLIDEVSAAVVGQLDDLRRNGPDEREFDNAVATIREELNFFNNAQINDEVLDALVDPDGSTDFDDFLGELRLVDTISIEDVTEAISDWAPGDRYIEVRVVPRD